MSLLKYAKPYAPMIIAAIILLFIQANVNLALPDNMSKIINVGIQQGGIEDKVPVAITDDDMNKTLLFLTDPSDQAKILDHYKLYSKESDAYDKYKKLYPEIKHEPIYVLKNLSDSN